jgi:MULE transposase domain
MTLLTVSFFSYDDNVENDGSDADSDVIFFHQSQWQRHLLLVYGCHVTLIDCTYNTTVYDLPLLTVAVKTNCGFFIAATALLASESTDCVTTALDRIRDANPDWHPSAFVSDFSEAQLGAVKKVFPGWRSTFA